MMRKLYILAVAVMVTGAAAQSNVQLLVSTNGTLVGPTNFWYANSNSVRNLMASKLDTNSTTALSITNPSAASSRSVISGTALSISNANYQSYYGPQFSWTKRWSGESNAWHYLMSMNTLAGKLSFYRFSSQGPYGVNAMLSGSDDSGGGSLSLYDVAGNLTIFASGLNGTIASTGGFIGLNTGTTNASGQTIAQEIAAAVTSVGAVTQEMLQSSTNITLQTSMEYTDAATNNLWKANLNLYGTGWSTLTNNETHTIEFYLTNAAPSFNTNTLLLTW